MNFNLNFFHLIYLFLLIILFICYERNKILFVILLLVIALHFGIPLFQHIGITGIAKNVDQL